MRLRAWRAHNSTTNIIVRSKEFLTPKLCNKLVNKQQQQQQNYVLGKHIIQQKI